jgi:hypothetical protein
VTFASVTQWRLRPPAVGLDDILLASKPIFGGRSQSVIRSESHRILDSKLEQGKSMSYVIKWLPVGQGRHREWPATFGTPSEAIEFAWKVLKEKPEDIWIEGPSNVRMDRDVIIRNCKTRGLV